MSVQQGNQHTELMLKHIPQKHFIMHFKTKQKTTTLIPCEVPSLSSDIGNTDEAPYPLGQQAAEATHKS